MTISPNSTSMSLTSSLTVAPLPPQPIAINIEVQTPLPTMVIPNHCILNTNMTVESQGIIPKATNMMQMQVQHTAGSALPTPASVPVPKSLAMPSIGNPPVPTPMISGSLPVQSTAKSKSKKKKNQPTVTMATATTATTGATGTQGENTGRWTADEHRLFLQGLEQYGKGWKKIASLIKSRTVVQIRTHAQKYFQKLAKARQNGEEGEISMEGRGGAASVAAAGLIGGNMPNNKRRRQTTGTKRKALTSVVISATREGKRMAAAQINSGVPCPVPQLPAVAPALAPFVVPPPQPITNSQNNLIPSVPPSHSSISIPALEDSLFRFLTPAPVQNENIQLNEVARQAGANPIILPADNQPIMIPQASGGDVSPTGVTDVAIFPSWTDAKDMPSWYAKGADIDCLLDVADTLDWLIDNGDLHENYDPPAPSLHCQATVEASPPLVPVLIPASHVPSAPVIELEDLPMLKAPSVNLVDALANDTEGVVPHLPSLFESSEPSVKKEKETLTHLPEAEIDDHLDVFDTPMEEHAFVSALLETGECSSSLPVL